MVMRIAGRTLAPVQSHTRAAFHLIARHEESRALSRFVDRKSFAIAHVALGADDREFAIRVRMIRIGVVLPNGGPLVAVIHIPERIVDDDRFDLTDLVGSAPTRLNFPKRRTSVAAIRPKELVSRRYCHR